MKAAVLHATGDAPRFEDFAEPAAGAGETPVRVTAAPIKPLDRAIAAGTHYSSPKADALPIVAGQDGVGLLPDGTRAYFMAARRPFGTMAERSLARWTAPVPDALDDAAAAALVNPALAAWLPLAWRGGLQAGETVLVLGATGAAGGMAVRAARLLGAKRVIGAGRNRQVLDALDLDLAIDLALPADDLVEAFRDAGPFDVVVDYLWGPPVEALLRALTSGHADVAGGGERGIRLVAVGESAGPRVAMPSGVFRSSHLQLIGSGTGNFPPDARMRALVTEIFAHAVAGDLPIEVERVPLAEIAAAWPRAATASRRLVLMP